MTALVCPSKSTGSTMMLTRWASPRLDEMVMKSGGTSVSRMRFFSTRALADQALAEFDGLGKRAVPSWA